MIMRLINGLLFAECFITLVTFVLGMYMVCKVNRCVNLRLEEISPNIPKVKLFTIRDITHTLFISLIPIVNFIYISVACFNLNSVIKQSTNAIVSMVLDDYLKDCKDKIKRLEELKELISKLKNVE